MTEELNSLNGIQPFVNGNSNERLIRDGLTNIGISVICECGKFPPKTSHEPQPIADQVKETFICECGVKTIRLLSIHY